MTNLRRTRSANAIAGPTVPLPHLVHDGFTPTPRLWPGPPRTPHRTCPVETHLDNPLQASHVTEAIQLAFPGAVLVARAATNGSNAYAVKAEYHGGEVAIKRQSIQPVAHR